MPDPAAARESVGTKLHAQTDTTTSSRNENAMLKETTHAGTGAPTSRDGPAQPPKITSIQKPSVLR